MRFFKRRSAAPGTFDSPASAPVPARGPHANGPRPEEALAPSEEEQTPKPDAPLGCRFCGASGFGVTFHALRDSAYEEPRGHCCEPCHSTYPQLAARLQFRNAPGHRPWLLPDSGTQHPVRAKAHSLKAVEAIVERLAGALREDVPPAAAALTALRVGVWGPEEEIPCASHQEARKAVSLAIADLLDRHHEKVKKYLGPPDYAVHSVAAFGAGAGVLYQAVTTSGDWLEQTCFLIDRAHTVHRYTNYDR